MFPEVDLRSDVKDAIRWLDDVQRQQVPFAASQALNSTAFDVRQGLIDQTFPRDFTLRNRSFARALLRVGKSTKRMLTASVYDALGRAYIETQAMGGTKTPHDGRSIAVPSDAIKRTGAGKVPQAKKPKAILATNKGVLIEDGAQRQIYERKRGRKAGLTLLYNLVPSARIPKRLRFYEDGSTIARRVFAKHFVAALERALKTAR